ncbi:MAG: mandelate racemase/muconate lactonizing enzyme family protein [Actinobacteria bacterium]|nr:mandelate racemase/muconate lactonizing enzyme family protein [Actinomycetota bacterium]
MRIDRIRIGYAPVPMRAPMRTAIHSTTHTHNALVEITADGVSGQGAALTLAAGQAQAVCRVLEDFAGLLHGTDPRDIRALAAQLRQRVSLTGQSGISMLALSAIDTALWDLHARAADLPLYRMLGGSPDPLPVYAQPGWLSLSDEELVAEALAVQEQGFGHYKMRVGSPDWRHDVQRVSRVRAALDPATQLLVDANQGWSRIDALAAARALDDLALFWLEEPVDVDDVAGMARVAAAIRTPVAAGESVFGTEGMRPLIEHGAAAVLMPDLQHCGGPTGFLLAAAQAQLAGLPISNHLFIEVSIHLLAACPNAAIVEYMPGWWDDLFHRPPDIRNGTLRPSDEPGTGVRFRDDAEATLVPAD